MPKLPTHGIINGAALTVTTTAALMAASRIERGSPWAAINPICHMIDGDERDYGDVFSARDSLIGLASNASAMLAWGMMYRLAFSRAKWPKSLLTGSAMAFIAYVTDYHLVPKRFTPGIEKRISWKAIAAIYVVFAATLAAVGDQDR